MSESPADRHVRCVKQTNEEYRKAAAALIKDVAVSAQLDVRVNPHGLVQPTEDGAYVELQMWVPKSALEQP